MAVNKVDLANGETLIDLTGDSATESVVFEGATFHGSDGETRVGTFTIDEEITQQDSLIERIKAALQGKAAGGSGLPTQEKTVEITENGTVEVLPDEGYVLSKVAVNVDVKSALELAQELYQRVEYIESDGSAYLVTDFVADDNTCGIEAVITVGNYNSTATMGSRENSGNTRFYLPYPLGATSAYYGFNSAPKVTATVSQTAPFRWQTNFLNSRLAGIYTFDGASVGSTAITENLTPHTVPVAIFGLYSGADGGVTSAKKMKLYGARCSKGFDVVREYIPCYRKSDGVVGLLEKFTGTFLTAEEGTFSKGADIDW